MRTQLEAAIAAAERRYAEAKRNSRSAEEKTGTVRRQLTQLQAAIDSSTDVNQRRDFKARVEVLECESVAAANAVQASRSELNAAQSAIETAQKALREHNDEVRSLQYRLNTACKTDIRMSEDAVANAQRDLEQARKRLERAQSEKAAIEARLALLTQDEQPAQAQAA